MGLRRTLKLMKKSRVVSFWRTPCNSLFINVISMAAHSIFVGVAHGALRHPEIDENRFWLSCAMSIVCESIFLPVPHGASPHPESDENREVKPIFYTAVLEPLLFQ